MRIFDPWYGVVRVKTDVLLRSIFMEIFQKKSPFYRDLWNEDINTPNH